MTYIEEFEGFGVIEGHDWRDMKKVAFKPKAFGPRDVDIQIEACGICGSDVLCGAGRWGPLNFSPLVPGHEIIGKVIRIGAECQKDLSIGDRVGIGAQVGSCLECNRCKSGNEAHCPDIVVSFNGVYPDGHASQGGFASHIRVHEHFIAHIPENIPSHIAAPLMCGGITAYTPLLRKGIKKGQNVAVVGIGGIGHMCVVFAKAFGANVYAISRSSDKRKDTLKLGADHFFSTSDDSDWEKAIFDKIDLTIICSNSFSGIDMQKLVKVMKIGGSIVSVAEPDVTEPFDVRPLLFSGVTYEHSIIGSMAEMVQMLALVSEKSLKFCVETLPICEKNLTQVMKRMEAGDVRFRFTMTDYSDAFMQN